MDEQDPESIDELHKTYIAPAIAVIKAKIEREFEEFWGAIKNAEDSK